MLRVILFSFDSQLQERITSVFGGEYHIVTESAPELLAGVLKQTTSTVVLLDIDTRVCLAETYIQALDQVVESDASAVLIVNEAARSTAVELVARGAHSYCTKPLNIRELKALLGPAHEHSVMRRMLKTKSAVEASAPQQLDSCDALIGGSGPMRQVYDLIHRVTNLRASVLITGETGTGKELIARAIHNQGDRKNQPFVAVSCGAFPETLIESELFGHEKGAFTGTVGTRIGYFEQAAGGTLFLDEIAELSPQIQVKLLRVLQQREFFRLGSTRPIPLRARPIFATHRNLLLLIEEGKFRLDLYYRLNVVTIHSPSLADRPEDIGLLARHFLAQYAELYGKYVRSISPAAIAALESYEWPGNVRELENVMQRAIICTDSQELQPSNLPSQIHASHDVLHGSDIVQSGTFERMLRDYKVKLAMKAVEDCNGNKTLAARSLDISRAYLHRLIRQTDAADAAGAA